MTVAQDPPVTSRPGTPNLPPVLENVLLGLQFSPVGQKAFLWAADTHDRSRLKYQAEEYAQEVARLTDVLSPAIQAAADGYGGVDPEVTDDLMKFILKRHANHRFGGNVQMWWEGESA